MTQLRQLAAIATLCLSPFLATTAWSLVAGSKRPPLSLLFTGCAIYGLLRVVVYHPIFRSGYLSWLQTTHWSVRDPLPFGRVLPGWQDAVVISAGCLLLHRYDPQWLGFATAIGYLFPMQFALMQADRKAAARCQVLLAGCCVAGWGNVWWMWLSLFAMLAIAMKTHRSVLARLPRLKPIESQPSRPAAVCWPFPQLAPFHRMRGNWWMAETVPRRDALILSGLMGWCIGAIALVFERFGFETFTFYDFYTVQQLVTVPIGFSIVCAVARTVRYCLYHRSPLGPIARVVLGRPLIPEFDVVFVAPLLTVCLTGSLAHAGVFLQAPISIVYGLCGCLAMLCTIGIGPTYEAWCFTGGHRLDPRMIVKAAVKSQNNAAAAGRDVSHPAANGRYNR